MTLRLSVLVLCVALCFMSPAQGRAAGAAVTPQVKAVLEKAMDVQTRADLQGDAHRKERAELVHKLIADNFHSGEMAKNSVKEEWDKLTPKQRSEFQDLFTQLFEDSYTRLVLNFLQRETIEYGKEYQKDGSGHVETVIMRSNEHIPVNYELAQSSGRWLIRDVEIDGVSIVENYHSTFRRVIQADSFEGLLKKMRIQSQALGDRPS